MIGVIIGSGNKSTMFLAEVVMVGWDKYGKRVPCRAGANV